MWIQTGRTWIREDAVRYFLSSGKTTSEVARELGVTSWSLGRWRNALEAKDLSMPLTSQVVATSVEGQSALEMAREIGQLKRELKAVTRQRETF